MTNSRKRSHSSSSPSSRVDPGEERRRRHHHHHHHHHHHDHNSKDFDYEINNHVSHHQVTGKRANFISYRDIPNLPPKLKLLCEIISDTPAVNVERILDDTGVRVSKEDVEDVLKLSYGYPGSAVKFFRWSSFQLNSMHSTYAWNLIVDLLGKNCLFDAMWDAIKSMKKETLLSLATFKSVFSNYVNADRVQEAILSFEVMDQYGVSGDIVSLNCLLYAICSDGKTLLARDYVGIVKEKVKVDAETYAILLEGWEREGDVVRARQTFSEMVIDIGWDKRNVCAYDAFLCTLLKGPEGMREVVKFFDAMMDRGCYPSMKFFKFAIDECVRKCDAGSAKVFWEAMVGKNICRPDLVMYKLLISLYCNAKDFDLAAKMLDEMVYNGAFPDSETYCLLFRYLIKNRRLKEATPLFKEMVKNEFVPTQRDCSTAVKAYLDAGDPHLAIRVWRCMVENYDSDLDETSNVLVVGLRDMNRVPEAVKCAEEMIERGIKLSSATLTKLKQSLSKVGKAFSYEELLRKWKSQ